MRLLRGRVAVRMHDEPSNIIIIVNPAETEGGHRGTVLAVGQGAYSKRGIPIEPEYAVGDEVLFHFEATQKGREAPWVDGETALFLAQREIDAVIEP